MRAYGSKFRCDICTTCTEREVESGIEATFCEKCEICYQLDQFRFQYRAYDAAGTGGVMRNFTACSDCSGCVDCKPNNPPGLKGHSMLMADNGVIVYGGATWTVTDLELTD